MRDRFNEINDAYEKALLFLYLNRHGYNGLCRYNKSGKFNVPFGKCAKPYFPEFELHSFYVSSRTSEFICQDFKKTFSKLRKGDVVYCDPPYIHPSHAVSFTDFTSQGFAEDDQRTLATLAEKASDKGIPVLVSNHDTSVSREIYASAQVKSFKVRRRISSKVSKREAAAELLALYRGE